MKKDELPGKLIEVLKNLGGRGTILEICKKFWELYGKELNENDNLFYTWQYDIRWAATELRKSKIMKPKEISSKGVWELS
ncbi:hypothetical protein [Desulfuribacillus alkaliarsenatis]|uniref:Restriction system protein Mrr-like N-terminal domain-containing protein n=1 Tax=Desulfuribacillus alkaliarsenatis TaxID=766136 RepID=A0A1E5G0K3_9FIRM|nr:hypothetical protein [Desulfuribacillus alkaliarsenatis]OEF96361.1 hypothetical protein BHF68_09430 [Desulfuribacillus alkaliarsenatis]